LIHSARANVSSQKLGHAVSSYYLHEEGKTCILRFVHYSRIVSLCCEYCCALRNVNSSDEYIHSSSVV